MDGFSKHAGKDPVESFAALRQRMEATYPSARFQEPKARLPLQLPTFDEANGGIPCGVLTEVVEAPEHGGSGLLLEALLDLARRERQYCALIDAGNHFDPEGIAPGRLEHLLWIRCRQPQQAVEAADILLRDRNFRFHLLDFRIAETRALQRLPSHTWFRLQRLVRQEDSVAVCLCHRPLIPSAGLRLECGRGFSLAALDLPREQLRLSLQLQPSGHTRQSDDLRRLATS